MSAVVASLAEVTFHFNVANPVAYMCRLLYKAHQARLRTLLYAPTAWVTQVDVALWQFKADEFIPHALLSARHPVTAAVQAHSPIWLADQLLSWPKAQVLVNAMPVPHLPPLHPGYRKLIEVVSLDETERQMARQRWRAYQAGGYVLHRHDAATVAH